MARHSFALVVDGVDLSNDDVINKLMGEGIDDASFAVRSGRHIVFLDREALT